MAHNLFDTELCNLPALLGQDDASTAAVLATTLQRLLGGAPRRYRELQGAESSLFRLARLHLTMSPRGQRRASFGTRQAKSDIASCLGCAAQHQRAQLWRCACKLAQHKHKLLRSPVPARALQLLETLAILLSQHK